MSTKIKQYIANNITYLDGGMGTMLMERGLKAGERSETWNLTNPEEIVSVHRAYFDAGANIVCANTFGANLLHYGQADLEEIIKSAVQNAKTAREQSVGEQQKWIALDIGPSGKLLEPYGDLSFEDAVNLFAQTVKLGVKYGVDLIMIETMNDGYETKAALLAVKENCDLPVFVSNAYGQDGKLMTGANVESMVAMLEGMGADAIGVNCSLGPCALKGVVEEYLKYSSLPIIVKPNAGLPTVKDGKTAYSTNEIDFASEMQAIAKIGATILGGCCGTTPNYIKLLCNNTASVEFRKIEKKERCVVSSLTSAVEIGKTPILIGERINPTGKKLLKDALKNGDIDYLLDEGVKQDEKGVHILDVNVGLPEINEVEMLESVVKELQTVTTLPLQIDSSNARAMEKALRVYNGKALINSVNGKEESMREIFPLVKKYGGVVIALTLDENGIPKNAEGRVEIAKKILNEAQKYGLRKCDLIFDPLALTVSADDNSAFETLRAVSMISKEMKCLTSLGISNVSFGLPRREIINSTFFALALQSGLAVAIINPFCAEIMNTYYSFRTLSGMDKSCNEYISYASAPNQTQIVEHSEEKTENGSPLFNAIVKGFKEQAYSLTEKLLQQKDGFAIINDDIIPALNFVGEGYENKKLYLPQLLTSAESAKNAFAKIKESIKTQSATKCKIVIATVKGDVHDIGKNIVKLLLENYGFEVIDLGKDVESEEIVETAKKTRAHIVGLSALMTTTVPFMEETIKLLRKDAPWCKIVVGGAVLNENYAQKIGADKYAKDGMEAVRYAEKINSEIN